MINDMNDRGLLDQCFVLNNDSLFNQVHTTTYTNNVQIPVVADIHTSDDDVDEINDALQTNNEQMVVNETYSTSNSCNSYADQSSSTSSAFSNSIHLAGGIQNMNVHHQQQEQQSQNEKMQHHNNNTVLVKQFEVSRKNLINNNNGPASNSGPSTTIEYVNVKKSDTISKVNLADSLNNEKSVTKDVQKIKKKDGFLSRIGLRFSFRGKKPKKLPTEATAVYNQLDENSKVESKKVPNKPRQDIIFIPLKDPSKANVESFIRHEIEAAASSPVRLFKKI